MKLDNVMMCIFALILGLLTIHMFSNVCGCKSIVEGQCAGRPGMTSSPGREVNCDLFNNNMDSCESTAMCEWTTPTTAPVTPTTPVTPFYYPDGTPYTGQGSGGGGGGGQGSGGGAGGVWQQGSTPMYSPPGQFSPPTPGVGSSLSSLSSLSDINIVRLSENLPAGTTMDSPFNDIKHIYLYSNLNSPTQNTLKHYLTENTYADPSDANNKPLLIAQLFEFSTLADLQQNIYGSKNSRSRLNALNTAASDDSPGSTTLQALYRNWDTLLTQWYVIWSGDDNNYDWTWWLLSDPIDATITLDSLSSCGGEPGETQSIAGPDVGDPIGDTSGIGQVLNNPVPGTCNYSAIGIQQGSYAVLESTQFTCSQLNMVACRDNGACTWTPSLAPSAAVAPVVAPSAHHELQTSSCADNITPGDCVADSSNICDWDTSSGRCNESACCQSTDPATTDYIKSRCAAFLESRTCSSGGPYGSRGQCVWRCTGGS